MSTDPIGNFLQSLNAFFEANPESRDENARDALASINALAGRIFGSQQELMHEVARITDGIRRSGNTELARTMERLFDQAIGRTFENEQELAHEFELMTARVQRSGNTALTKAMERLFHQEIQRLHPSSADQERCAKRQREEGQDDFTWSLPEVLLPNIFTFLDQRSRGRASRVCTSWNRQIQTVRVFELSQLRGPEFKDLLPRFGITIPQGTLSSAEASAICRNIHKLTVHIFFHIKDSLAANYEETERMIKEFWSVVPHMILPDPNRLLALLRAANDHSLVMPFKYLTNRGLDLSEEKTLAEKAQAVRDHLRRDGNRYASLDCHSRRLFCVPEEICTLKNLRRLNLSHNDIVAVPPDIAHLPHLTELHILGNQDLSVLPKEIREKIPRPELEKISLTHGLFS